MTPPTPATIQELKRVLDLYGTPGAPLTRDDMALLHRWTPITALRALVGHIEMQNRAIYVLRDHLSGVRYLAKKYLDESEPNTLHRLASSNHYHCANNGLNTATEILGYEFHSLSYGHQVGDMDAGGGGL